MRFIIPLASVAMIHFTVALPYEYTQMEGSESIEPNQIYRDASLELLRGADGVPAEAFSSQDVSTGHDATEKIFSPGTALADNLFATVGVKMNGVGDGAENEI